MNGYAESFSGTLRDEQLLNRKILKTMLEAKVMIEHLRGNHNTIRPNSALGYQPPAPETVRPHKPASATLQQPCAAGESLINSLIYKLVSSVGAGQRSVSVLLLGSATQY